MTFDLFTGTNDKTVQDLFPHTEDSTKPIIMLVLIGY